MDPVTASYGRRRLVFERAIFEDLQQVINVPDEQVARLFQLDRKGRVEHVRACHSLVKPPAFGPELLTRPGEEGNYVVLGYGFDAVDRLYVYLAQYVGVVSSPDGRGVLSRNHADLAHRLGGEHFDLPPDAVAVFCRPDGRHFGAGIAGNHGPRGLAGAAQRRNLAEDHAIPARQS